MIQPVVLTTSPRWSLLSRSLTHQRPLAACFEPLAGLPSPSWRVPNHPAGFVTRGVSGRHTFVGPRTSRGITWGVGGVRWEGPHLLQNPVASLLTSLFACEETG